jgi:hypothetical protein
VLAVAVTDGQHTILGDGWGSSVKPTAGCVRGCDAIPAAHLKVVGCCCCNCPCRLGHFMRVLRSGLLTRSCRGASGESGMETWSAAQQQQQQQQQQRAGLLWGPAKVVPRHKAWRLTERLHSSTVKLNTSCRADQSLAGQLLIC